MIRRPPRSTLFPYTSSSDLWGLRSQRDLYYQDELEALARAHPNFSFITTLSRPENGWTGERGRDSVVMKERSEEHTSELQSLAYLVCRLLLEKKKNRTTRH